VELYCFWPRHPLCAFSFCVLKTFNSFSALYRTDNALMNKNRFKFPFSRKLGVNLATLYEQLFRTKVFFTLFSVRAVWVCNFFGERKSAQKQLIEC